MKSMMNLHDQILETHQQGHRPFTPGGDLFDFVEAEVKRRIKLACPQVSRAVNCRIPDGNRQEAFTVSLPEARDLSRDFAAVKQKIQEICPRLAHHTRLIIEGNRIWNQEQDAPLSSSDPADEQQQQLAADVELLTTRLQTSRVPFNTKDCKAALRKMLSFGENLIEGTVEGGPDRSGPGQGFHSVLLASADDQLDEKEVDAQETTWHNRIGFRPSCRAGRGERYGEKNISRVVGYLSGTETGTPSNLILLATNWTNVTSQTRLHKDNQRIWPYDDHGYLLESSPSKIIAYWCPKDRSDPTTEMTLFLDFPDGHGLRTTDFAQIRTINHVGQDK